MPHHPLALCTQPLLTQSPALILPFSKTKTHTMASKSTIAAVLLLAAFLAVAVAQRVSINMG